jgi:hypothetical protein
MTNRVAVRTLLARGEHDYARLARPLLRALESMHRFEIDVVTEAGELEPGRAQVLLAASDQPLSTDLAGRLAEFVRRGGGLVLLHGTLASWARHGPIGELAAWLPGEPGPLTELVIRPDPDHPVTARLGSELRLRDELYLSEGPPAGGSVLMRASWRFTDQVVAY